MSKGRKEKIDNYNIKIKETIILRNKQGKKKTKLFF